MASPLARLAPLIPAQLRDTLAIRAFGLFKVPMIAFCRPTVLHNDGTCVRVRLPLGWRTRNHLRSMYFGALSVGADVAAGFAALHHIRASGQPVTLVFKDFRATFLRRPEADVVFESRDGAAVGELVARAIATGERVEHLVEVVATTPSVSGDTPVATFALTLSLKLRRPA